MIQHIEAVLSAHFPVHPRHLTPIAGTVVAQRRMTDPLETKDSWEDLLESEHGISKVKAGDYGFLHDAEDAFEIALINYDRAFEAWKERHSAFIS